MVTEFGIFLCGMMDAFITYFPWLLLYGMLFSIILVCYEISSEIKKLRQDRKED